MEISVNLIIIAGFERPQKGWGGGVGGGITEWIAFFAALFIFFNRIMTQLACFTDLKCLKSLKHTYSDFGRKMTYRPDSVEVKTANPISYPRPAPLPPPPPPPRHLVDLFTISWYR